MTKEPKAKERKIPKRVQRIVDACERGQTLCKMTAMTRIGTTESAGSCTLRIRTFPRSQPRRQAISFAPRVTAYSALRFRRRGELCRTIPSPARQRNERGYS